MDINGHDGIAGQYDEKVKKVCGFGIKVIMDLCGASCVLYFIVEAAKKMKYPERNDKHQQQQQQWHIPKKRDWEVFFGLLLCFVLFFLLALHLITNCHTFVNDVIRCKNVEPLENENNVTYVNRDLP